MTEANMIVFVVDDDLCTLPTRLVTISLAPVRS